MVDVIANDDLLAKLQNTAVVTEALKSENLALENSALADLSSDDLVALSSLLASVSIPQIKTQFCGQIPLLGASCSNGDLAEFDDKLAIVSSEVDRIMDCTSCSDDELQSKISGATIKSNLFDEVFSTVSGQMATLDVDADINIFMSRIPALANYTSAFIEIGKIILDDPDYNPDYNQASIPGVQNIENQVHDKTDYKAKDVSFSNQALNKLGIPGTDINASSQKVYYEVKNLAGALVAFGSKLGMTDDSYEGDGDVKLSQLFTSADIVKKMGMIIPYQKTMAGVKEGCRTYMLGMGKTGVPITDEQDALGNACIDFVSMKEPGPGMKAVCLAVYGPASNDPAIVVPPLSSTTPVVDGKDVTAGVGVSFAIAKSCASIANGNFLNSDGQTLIPNIGTIGENGYLLHTTQSAWEAFNGAPSDFWDDISSSDYAWINFLPFAV